MRTFAVVNQKGGVGKTTTTANLAHALSLAGNRVTVIDLDPQGHLSASFGVRETGMPGMDRVLAGGAALDEVLIDVRERLRLAPSGARLSEVEHMRDDGGLAGGLLRDVLDGRSGEEDFMLIDSPPGAGLLVVNALYAVDEVIVPVAGDYLSLEALSRIMATFRNFERQLGHALKFWIVLTRFQSGRRLAREVQDHLLEYFPGELLATPIRENVALAECPGFGQTIFEYQQAGTGARDYRDLASDFVDGRVMQ